MRRQVVLAPPPAPIAAQVAWEEILVVLSLSLLQPAVWAVISLFRLPVAGIAIASANQGASFTDQLVPFVFELAPVLLVVHLLRRSGEGLATVGLLQDRPRRDLGRGVLLFVLIGLGGIAVYLGAVQLGVNRFVVPAPPAGYWWTYPAVLMNGVGAALLEEVIVLGYLVTRLQQVGWPALAAVAGSALLRGGYHLYQGWGGFAGNLAMGLIFGWLFVRTRRLWPFVVAHLLLDVGAAVGFLLFKHHLPGF